MTVNSVSETVLSPEVVSICETDLPYVWNVNGKNLLYKATGIYYDTLTVDCSKTISVLDLTVNTVSETVLSPEVVSICEKDLPYVWSVNGKSYNATDIYYDTVEVNCTRTISVLDLTVNSVSETVLSPEVVSICEKDLPYVWSVNGKSYNATDIYYDTVEVNCTRTISVLDLTVNSVSETVLSPEVVSICEKDLPYVWSVNGKSYNATDIYYDTVEVNCSKTISVLDLTVLPGVVYEPTETDYFCPGSTYDWRGHTFKDSGTYYDTVYNALGCESNIYTLELMQYVNTIPTITIDDVVAVCGKAIDVTIADAIINAHIASEQYYAPNAEVKWYVLSGNTYTELTNTAMDGTITEVNLKFVVTTDCGVVESDPIVVQVQTPSPENDDTLAEIPAYNKYGGRLLTADIKYIKETFGLDVAEDEVTWYLENGDNDIEQGQGYYLTTEDGTPLPAGQYYAIINYQGKNSTECDVILQTITLVVETQVDPLLIPTVARPSELIRLLNLDADATSTVSIYSSTGQQLESFQIKDAKETSFEAAHVAGYYIVEVQTESDKVSLRYVVK